MHNSNGRFQGSLRLAGKKTGELPRPTAEEQAHSDKLITRIRDEIIAAGGAIDFARYMELALYAPGLGYYAAGTRKIGEAGDFVTAPELSPLFGRCIARQCQQVLEQLGGGDILEAGAGTGMLAVACLQELEARDCLPGTYFILEVSPDLRERQSAIIKQELPHLVARVRWIDTLPAGGFRGVVIGNELLDAMPVQRFHVTGHDVQQLTVGWDDGQFRWRQRPAGPEMATRIAALELPIGYVSEINFHAEAWIRSVAESVGAGLILLIDYGFPRAEFYHPQRDQGTLMCHYRHRAHDDPLILVGLQDITAHIDFTAIAEAAHEAGLAVLGYTSQATFLLGLGIDQFAAAEDAADTRRYLGITQQIKKLTLPHEMGELFKAIAFGRNIDMRLLGFSLQDRRGRL